MKNEEMTIKNEIKIISNNVEYSSRGNPTYTLIVKHKGLGEKKVLKAKDSITIEEKYKKLEEQWGKAWLNKFSLDLTEKKNAELEKYKYNIANFLKNELNNIVAPFV